ncbi:MAG: methyltransferase domain-containing protein [Planctomycetes bacterium]|nr:methyltransferase domain-containing protein [Planctomycetota bacterium]
MPEQPPPPSTETPAARPPLPRWRLPVGVPRSLWDYFQSPHIALDYDAYFQGNSLFEFDEAFIAKHLTRPGWLADLGCGTGRLLVPFARRGFRGLAVDLSAHMLGVVRGKAMAENLPIDLLLANLAELDCLGDASIDYAICMFSTLGMVQGASLRRRVLDHVFRALKPGGMFILHVHNRWHHLHQHEGRRWLLVNWLRSVFLKDSEPGDKWFDYRGIPQMYLHAFTRRELRALLTGAGFEIVEMMPLDTERRHALPHAWFFERLRANGWITACRKPVR